MLCNTLMVPYLYLSIFNAYLPEGCVFSVLLCFVIFEADFITSNYYYLLNACIRVADVMKFTFVSLMPVHNVCRICKIIKE